MVDRKQTITFTSVSSASNFLFVLGKKVGNTVRMTVEVIPEETDQVDEQLSEQLKNWKDNPFDPSSSVYVYERPVVPYEEVEELIRTLENEGFNAPMVVELKHLFVEFWSRKLSVEELLASVSPLVDEMKTRFKKRIEIPTYFEMKYCFARDVQNTLHGGEFIHGIFTDINEALAYINSTKARMGNK